MSKTILTALCMLLFLANSSFAAPKSKPSTALPPHSINNSKFGIGLILGEPTAITGKFFLDQGHAVDFGISYSASSFFKIYSDYLFHFPLEKYPALVPYIGAGGILLLSTSEGRHGHRYMDENIPYTAFAVRIPLGIEVFPEKLPLGVFLEIAPGIGFIPSTFPLINGGIGIRVYF